MQILKFSLLLLAMLLLCRCDKPRCNDGRLNGDESEIDCGGLCPPCYSCEDGYKNQGETHIDCGGPHCKSCPDEWEPLGNVEPPIFLEDISILDSTLMFAAGGNQVLKSRDGGKSWEPIGPQDSPPDRQFRWVKFFDELNGYAVSEYFNNGFFQWLGTSFATHDGGLTWNIQKNKFGESENADFSPGRIFVATYSGVISSEDDGETFHPVNGLPAGSGEMVPYNVGFFDNENGYLLAHHNVNEYEHFFSLTSDGGQTWQPFTSVGPLEFWTFKMFAKDVAIAIPRFQSNMHLTTNGGQTWKELINPSLGFPYFFFKDSQTGYLLGQGPVNEEFYSYKTNDGGLSWEPFGRYNKDRLDNYEYVWQVKQAELFENWLYVVGSKLMRVQQ